MQKWVRIGDMLVEAGLVTEEQVGQALKSQRESGRRLGEELVALGLVAEVQLTQVLSNQLSVPWVSLRHVEFSRELLNRVPSDLAQQHCMIPIYIRRVRDEGETLFVAMDDPTKLEALAAVRESTGLPVKPMVAPPSEIRQAIRVFYLGVRGITKPVRPPDSVVPEATDRSEATTLKLKRSAPPPKSSQPPDPPKPPPSPAAQRSAEASEPHAPQNPPAAEAQEAAPTSSQPPAPAEPPPQPDPPSTPPPKPARGGPRMVTLTLLDGTTVRVPAPRQSRQEEVEDHAHSLTTADLIAALLARSAGADVSDVLPDDRWESVFATLLRILLRKGLIADWEFVAEWSEVQARRPDRAD